MRKKCSWKMWAVSRPENGVMFGVHDTQAEAQEAIDETIWLTTPPIVIPVLVTELKRGGKKTTSK